MGPEVLESAAMNRLDLAHRSGLQFELMKQMLGDKPSYEDQLVWAKKYGKKVSELIDYDKHDEIRDLALEENYVEAAQLLRNLLEE